MDEITSIQQSHMVSINIKRRTRSSCIQYFIKVLTNKCNCLYLIKNKRLNNHVWKRWNNLFGIIWENSKKKHIKRYYKHYPAVITRNLQNTLMSFLIACPGFLLHLPRFTLEPKNEVHKLESLQKKLGQSQTRLSGWP